VLRSIYAAQYHHHAAVPWLEQLRGQMLQTHSSSGVVGPSMRSIATDAQQWCGRSIHTANCYRCASVSWSVHLRGLLLQTRSSVAWSVHPRGLLLQPRSSVVWSVHLRGLLLQTHSSGVVGPSTRPIVTDAQQWCGRSIYAAHCYRRAAVAWSDNPRDLLLLGLWSNNPVANAQANTLDKVFVNRPDMYITHVIGSLVETKHRAVVIHPGHDYMRLRL